MPVALETTAQVRLFGAATLRMTYDYWKIDGRPSRRGHAGAAPVIPRLSGAPR